MKFLLITLLVLIFLLPHHSEAQRAFFLNSDEGAQIVRKVTRSHYHYGADVEHSVRIGEVATRLIDYSGYVPGYVEIRHHELVINTIFGQHAGLQDEQNVTIYARVRANRDLENVFMIVHWRHDSGQEFRIVGSVGGLRGGRTQAVDFQVQIPDMFEHSRYSMSLYSNGIEVRSFTSGATVDTPFQRYLRDFEGTTPPDGQPSVLHFVRPMRIPAVPEGESNRVLALVDIDRAGYVTKVKIEESPERVHGSMVAEALRLWEFKPLIRNGKPESTQIRVPIDL